MPSLTSSPVRDGWNGSSSASPHQLPNPVRRADSTSPESLYDRLRRLEIYEAERAQTVKLYETERAQLLNDTIATLKSTQTESEGYRALARNWFNTIEDLKTRNVELEAYVRRGFKVITLIDGNGLPFQDFFVQAGGQGGKPAADALCDAVSTFLGRLRDLLPASTRSHFPEIHELKFATKVYLDAQELAETCMAAGIADSATDVREFLYVLGNSIEDFEVIDVGSDRHRVLKKISETFKKYASDPMCQQIILGCAHDANYIRVFDDVTNTDFINKVTLIEGPVFANQFKSLPFGTEKFVDVFRDTQIKVKSPSDYYGNSQRNGSSGRVSTPPGLGRTKNESRTASFSSSNATPSSAVSTPAFTWASAAKHAAALPDRTATPPPKAVLVANTIPRNRAGQRVDPVCRTYDKKEVDRLKEIKMCNVHFLRQECRYGKDCTHFHNYKPTPNELATLRLIARMAPCSFGSACEDVKCIYGHRCPAPAKAGATGGKNCIFGEECRFPVELHNIDTTVVRSVVIR